MTSFNDIGIGLERAITEAGSIDKVRCLLAGKIGKEAASVAGQAARGILIHRHTLTEAQLNNVMNFALKHDETEYAVMLASLVLLTGGTQRRKLVDHMWANVVLSTGLHLLKAPVEGHEIAITKAISIDAKTDKKGFYLFFKKHPEHHKLGLEQVVELKNLLNDIKDTIDLDTFYFAMDNIKEMKLLLGEVGFAQTRVSG